MLTVQHLSRLGPQGAIVSKGAGPPPLVTGRRVKPIIGEAWEIQQGRGGGGTPSLWKSTFLLCVIFLFFSSSPNVRSGSSVSNCCCASPPCPPSTPPLSCSALIGPPSHLTPPKLLPYGSDFQNALTTLDVLLSTYYLSLGAIQLRLSDLMAPFRCCCGGRGRRREHGAAAQP